MKKTYYALLLLGAIMFSCNKKDKEVSVPFYGQFKEIPVGSVKPQGWAKQFLVNQRNGLTGYLENAGYPFNTVGWAADSIPGNKSIQKWWPYEQNAYWVDGMIRTGYLLEDTFLINKAKKSIDFVLAHQDISGFLGPLILKPNYEGDRWVHQVFFRSWMAEYGATHNVKLLEALKKHYLKERFPHTGCRESTNAEIILWTYAQTGDTALLHFAEDIYNNSNAANKNAETSPEGFMKDSMTLEHGVTYLEKSKLGAMLYLYTGKEEYLKHTVAAFNKIDKYHMLVDGIPVSSEHLDKVTSIESHEICDISDFTWNISYLLMATGDATVADKIEKAMFNAAPGSVTNDFKALQYFSAPNQVIANDRCERRGGGNQMRYAPNPTTECCPGNVNRMMPNYIVRSWLSDNKGGIAAAMYVPSVLKWKAGANAEDITINEETNYPFSDSITFTMSAKKDIPFTFYVRIPAWCSAPKVLVNGQPVTEELKAGYVPINRTYKDGDKVTVILPQELKLINGPENGITVSRGPLLYALKIEEDWQVDTTEKRSTVDFPAYNLYAKSPWNYALELNPANLASAIQVIKKPYSDKPWNIESTPIELKVPARQVAGWELLKKKEMLAEKWDVIRNAQGKVVNWIKTGEVPLKGDWSFTPALPDAKTIKNGLASKTDTITLVPYGSAKLRISIFPKVD